jgi:hypothetical protein
MLSTLRPANRFFWSDDPLPRAPSTPPRATCSLVIPIHHAHVSPLARPSSKCVALPRAMAMQCAATFHPATATTRGGPR